MKTKSIRVFKNCEKVLDFRGKLVLKKMFVCTGLCKRNFIYPNREGYDFHNFHSSVGAYLF